MKYTILAALFLLTACEQGHPVSKDVSFAQLAADKNQCNFEAAKATAGGDSSILDEAHVYNACLTAKGYH